MFLNYDSFHAADFAIYASLFTIYYPRVSPSSELLVIINNAAAKARAAWPRVQEELSAANISFAFHETKHVGDATNVVREALHSGTKTVAVVGGDGTLSEAAEGFFEFALDLNDFPTRVNPEACLAILPAGTGDDFARSQKGRRESLDLWTNILVEYARATDHTMTRVVDVLYGVCNAGVRPFICINASTMGIGGETATRVAAQGNFTRKFSGEARFAFAAVVSLARWRERRVRVTVDDSELVDGPMNLVAVANALYAGGGMMLSPQAKIDDGKLDVITASGLNRAHVLRELTRIHKGGHVLNPKVRVMQGEAVSIETFSVNDAMPIEADGNVRGYTPVVFRIMPKALRFVVG